MIVVLDVMLFGYDGMKRLVHAGECFKAFALTGRKAITSYSPGQRPGYKAFVTLRPVRAKALKPSLYWFHFLANLFHAAESDGLGGASFGIRICLMVPSLFLTS